MPFSTTGIPGGNQTPDNKTPPAGHRRGRKHHSKSCLQLYALCPDLGQRIRKQDLHALCIGLLLELRRQVVTVFAGQKKQLAVGGKGGFGLFRDAAYLSDTAQKIDRAGQGKGAGNGRSGQQTGERQRNGAAAEVPSLGSSPQKWMCMPLPFGSVLPVSCSAAVRAVCTLSRRASCAKPVMVMPGRSVRTACTASREPKLTPAELRMTASVLTSPVVSSGRCAG